MMMVMVLEMALALVMTMMMSSPLSLSVTWCQYLSAREQILLQVENISLSPDIVGLFFFSYISLPYIQSTYFQDIPIWKKVFLIAAINTFSLV